MKSLLKAALTISFIAFVEFWSEYFNQRPFEGVILALFLLTVSVIVSGLLKG